jgi:hypothetical protein
VYCHWAAELHFFHHEHETESSPRPEPDQPKIVNVRWLAARALQYAEENQGAEGWEQAVASVTARAMIQGLTAARNQTRDGTSRVK